MRAPSVRERKERKRERSGNRSQEERKRRSESNEHGAPGVRPSVLSTNYYIYHPFIPPFNRQVPLGGQPALRGRFTDGRLGDHGTTKDKEQGGGGETGSD